MKNAYQVYGNEVAITVRVYPTRQDVFCWIDLADLDKLLRLDVGWYANPARAPIGKYYVNGKLWNRVTQKSDTLLMHRVLMDYPKYEVHHIDNDGLNNRRSTNLTTLTHKDNMRERWPKRDWSVRDERAEIANEYREERRIALAVEREIGVTRQCMFRVRRGIVNGPRSKAAKAYREALAVAGIRSMAELRKLVFMSGDKWGVVRQMGKVIE